MRINAIKLLATLLAGLFLWVHPAPAQPLPGALQITYSKTVSIVFPTIIKSVDRGSRDILVQKAKGVENVLQIKAARLGFPETNLTVITTDGHIHQFAVTYAANPPVLLYNVSPPADQTEHRKMIFRPEMTETDLLKNASAITEDTRRLRGKSHRKFRMQLQLRGIYIKSDVIFYHVVIENRSHIPYNTDFLRFYIRDRTKARRTASQEVSVTPIYVYGDWKSVEGTARQHVVFALEKFTIPDAKFLAIEMFEQNGGRHLSLTLRNRMIVKAKPIPEQEKK